MNPYASFLGERDPRHVIAATPGRLSDALWELGSEAVERPYASGKWTVRQVVCHLADTELVFAFRWRQALAEPHHVIQPFDQDLWAASYGAYGAQQARQAFTVLRGWNLALIRTLTPESMSKPLTHPERGTMTLQVLLETMAGHDLNHLRQIESAVAAAQ